MERFRKCVETVRCKWREFVSRNWYNQPEGDNFRLLDVVLLVGAVRSRELSEKWQRNCWRAYRMMALFHYCIFVLNFVEVLSDKTTTAFGEVVWHTCVFVGSSMIFVQHMLLNGYFGSIQAGRDFINSKPAHSEDVCYDVRARERLFRRVQLTSGILLLMAFFEEIVVIVPNAGIETLLVIPRVVRSLGPGIATGAQFLFTAAIIPLWVCKRFATTSLMCSLLFGFQTELDIFSHGFDNIWNRVQQDVEDSMPPTSSSAEGDQPASVELRRVQREKLFWKFFNQHVTNNIKKHVELLENLKSLEPAVKWQFFEVYYYCLVIVSPAIYVDLLEGISGFTVVLTAFVVGLLLECYMWCSQIEACKDINDGLEMSITDLMTKMQFSKEHHADDYAGMRKTLMIMKMNVRNSCQFTCGGVFDISVKVVTDLLNVSYSVLTFLRDVGNVYAR